MIDETVEKTCLFHFNESDGHCIISALIVMVKLRRHVEFLDDVQATELVEMFAKMKRGKNAVIKCIHFLQSFLNITDKNIVKQLEDIPLFETDSNLVKYTV